MIKEFSTYNESTNYKIGDIAYYYGLEKKLHGEPVEVIRILSMGYTVKFLNLMQENRFVTDNKLRKEIKEIKRKYTEEDPYGEEDWSNVEESMGNSDFFEVGDIVYYYGDNAALHGEKVKIGSISHSSNEYVINFVNKRGESTRYVDRKRLSRNIKEIKRVYTPEDPYGEEDWDSNEKWNPFKRKPRAIKTPGKNAQIDPYGEEDWDEPTELSNKFYKLELDEGKWDRVYFKTKNDKYLLVFYKVTYPKHGHGYMIVPSFESGFSDFGGGNYEYLPNRLIFELLPVDDIEFDEIKEKLEEPNSYLKASDGRVLSNMELLKRRFIN